MRVIYLLHLLGGFFLLISIFIYPYIFCLLNSQLISASKMSKDIYLPYIDNSSWLDCIGELNEHYTYSIQPLPYDVNQVKIEHHFEHQIQKPSALQQKDQNQDLIDLISMQECIDKQMFKRSHPSTLMDDEFFTSNSSSNDARFNQNEQLPEYSKTGYKKDKYAKQYIYSKNYRDKKKQQFKALQEQNCFLKNKVEELQERLRQQQMQNNRLKHHSNQKELTIQQLNKQFLQTLSFLADSIQSTIGENQPKEKKKKTRADLQKQFIEGYEEQGFGGSKKKLILDYHMNEMLEVVLRDSQKYLCMLCCKNKDESFVTQMPDYQKINTAFFQIMELNEHDMQRLDSYVKFLFPAMKEIKKQCSDMYKNYNKIIQSMDRVHYLMKSTYIQNIDFVIKRMKVQSWFEYHKYHKIMRKLKAQWLEFIKSDHQSQDKQNTNKHKKGYKKKKVQQSSMYA